MRQANWNMSTNAVARERARNGREVKELGRVIVRAAEAKGLLNESSDTVLQVETIAAQWSIATQLYVSLQPSGFATIPASASDDIREGTSQCCRVGEISLCGCGHDLLSHESVKLPKRSGYIKPPKCSRCKKCPGFAYFPMYPEECGQWWLRRRRDFNLHDWRKVSTNQNIKSFCNLIVIVSIFSALEKILMIMLVLDAI